MKKMLIFVFPVMLSNLLQCMFNMADSVVVGRFAAEGNDALAAVGTCGTVANLLLNLAIGLSVGVNVFVARQYGAKDYKRVSDGVHTAIALALVLGVVFTVLGIVLTPALLDFVNVPEDIRGMSNTYMLVYFCGFIFTALFNFGSAVLRAVGDTARPLVFMMIAGVLNVVLNLFFVIVLKLSVLGVALATVISQAASAALVLITLLRTRSCYQLQIRQLRINRFALKQITAVGAPAGIQNTLFSLSNTMVQASVNSFGKLAMAGHTAAANVDWLLEMPMVSIEQASLAFASQNLGARRIDNIRKVERKSVFLNTLIAVVVTAVSLTGGEILLNIYNVDSPEMLEAGLLYLHIATATGGICSLMWIYAALMRGVGYSLEPMIVTLLGSCLLRIVWILFFLPTHHTLFYLYIIYPISWTITTATHFVCFRIALRKKEREFAASAA